MKNKEFAAIGKELSSIIPNFVQKGPMMLRVPIGSILNGLYFESHSHEATLFYLWVFCLPLYVPTKHVTFNFGHRLGFSWTSTDTELLPKVVHEIKKDALPFLSRCSSLSDFLEMAKADSSRNPHTTNEIAFTLVMMDRFQQAIETFDILLQQVDRKVQWEADLGERASKLKALLSSNPVLAQEQLKRWEEETVRNLGLEDFRG